MKDKKGQKEEKIGQALLKVALGYQLAEVTEEYAEVDGALKLTKRKKTKKDVPPDLKAVQLLLSSEGADYAQWSDEDLETEKQRLLAVLQEGEKTATKEGKTATKEGKTATKEVKTAVKTVKTTAKAVSTAVEKDDAEKVAVKKPRAKPRKRVVRKVKTEN